MYRPSKIRIVLYGETHNPGFRSWDLVPKKSFENVEAFGNVSFNTLDEYLYNDVNNS